MSKLVLFVCLVLGTVYANTQLSLMNAWYDAGSASLSPGLVANLDDFLNVTAIQSSPFYGKADSNTLVIPTTQYITLPLYSFQIGVPTTFSVVNMENVATETRPYTAEASTDGTVTLVENQSYTFVYVAASDTSYFSAAANFPTPKLLPFEERPNPSPYGKALVRIVNIAVSTFDPATNMTVNVTGNGVVTRTVSIAFGEASDFLEYDAPVDLTLEFTLPLDGGAYLNRTLSVSAILDHTQVVYIRGDTGDDNHLGSFTQSVDFAFPAAPVSPPVTPPTAEPVSAPVADTPTAPVASTTPTTPTARTPVKHVSSAAQTVAHLAGVAALASLLF